jgi:hypothetical protein
MPDTEEPMAMPEPAAVEQEDPQVANCLDLIQQAKYQEALPVCLAALAIDPDNQQVQDAVAKARAEAAKLAGAGEAAEAAEGAADEAAAQADEAAKGLADKLGQ